MHRPALSRHDFGAERDAGADNAAGQHRRLPFGGIIAGVDLADMSGIGAAPLGGIGGIIEGVVAQRIVGERHIVVARRNFERRPASPASDHPRGQQLGFGAELRGLCGHKAAELRDPLLQATKHHEGAIARPGRRQGLDRARLVRILRILGRIAEHEFARPDQVLSGPALIGGAVRLVGPGEAPDTRLRDAVAEAEMLVAALLAGADLADCRIDHFDRAAQHRPEVVAMALDEAPVGSGDQEHAVDALGGKVLQPAGNGRIVELSDRYGIVSTSFECRIELRAVRTEQLGHAVAGKPQVQAQKPVACRITQLLTAPYCRVALLHLLCAGDPADDMLL